MNLLDVNDRAGEYPRSYYADTADPASTRPAALGEIRADVCIVGGGFTGLSTALHLARRGFKSVVVEAQRVGFGASGRNGGQVGTGQRQDQDWLEQSLGRDAAHRLWDISRDAVQLVRDLCAELGEPFHDGIIHADHRARYVAESHAYAEKLAREYGHDRIVALDRAGLRDVLASDAYHGGTLDTFAGHFHPLRFALGLAQLAEAAGATIHEATRVERLDGTTVTTGQAVIRADHVILACNGYLGHLQGRVAARVMPINNYVVATEPMDPDDQEKLIANNYAVADSKFVVNYFRFSDDHRLLFGGTESYRYRFPADIAGAVRRPMEQVFPQIAGIPITHAWGGTLGITMNRMPHFERVGPATLSLSGYSGHGVAMATIAGLIAAETIAGQAERFDTMAAVPSPRFPGGAAFRSPLLVLAMLWYSLRDRL